MTTIAGLLLLAVAGGPLSRGLFPERSVAFRVGASFLVGSGVVSWVLLVMSLAGIEWNRLSCLMAAAVVFSSGWLLPKRPGSPAPPSEEPKGWERVSAIPVLLGVGAVAGGYALFATAGPLWEFDFLRNWGLKGRLFFIDGGLDWEFLQQARYRAIHPDYPVLLPNVFAWLSILSGAWLPEWLGLVHVAYALAALAIVFDEMRIEIRSLLFAALGSFILFPLLASPWIGLGEGPLVAYATAGVLVLRRSLNSGGDLYGGTLLLGLGAFTKNEGLALLGVVFLLALARTRSWRRVMEFWPALIVVAPWLITRAVLGLGTDLATGPVLARMAEKILDPSMLLATFSRFTPPDRFLWLGILIALIACWKATSSNRFLLFVATLQLGVYLVAYLASPHDIEWHVRWSWERIVSHVTPLVCFVAIVAAARSIREPDRGGGASDLLSQ